MGKNCSGLHPIIEKFQRTLILSHYDWPEFDLAYERFLLRHSPHAVRLNYCGLIQKIGVKKTQDEIERTIIDRGITHVFCAFFGDSYFLPLEFFIRLHGRARLVLWTHDDENYFEVHSKYYAQTMDAVVTTDYFAVPAYRRLGIPCVLCFSSFPKDIYRPIETTRDIAVSFVGNCGRSDRRAFILSLRSQGVDVRAYGQGSKNGFVPRPELSRIFSRSKINLNFTKMDFFGWHNMDDAVLTNRVRQNKGRPIEVALSRSFCLSEYAPALPHVFEIGREIDCFCDIPSLGDKVRYYLAHDEEREEMAQRSYQRALREYEDDPYMLKVLQELDAALNQPPPYCVDAPSAHKGPRFEERHVHQLSVQFFWWLSRGRIRLAWEVLPDLLQYGLKMFLIGFCKGMARSLGIVCAHRLWPRRPPDPL